MDGLPGWWITTRPPVYPQDAAEAAALGSRHGDALPDELARRVQRLATIAWAMRRLVAHAKREAEAERHQREFNSRTASKGVLSADKMRPIVLQ